ncbi:hypothetical protein A7G45_06115 [Mycolicibacterium llatzerense]|nr:hypothetical protein [Mycolicibacterium llatzerense]
MRLGAALAVALSVALAVVVDTDTVVVANGGAVTVVVTDGELGVWHAVAAAITAAPINAVNRIAADIRLPRV